MKQAVVIGGTRGIGEGARDALLAAGWRVELTGASAAEIEACAPRIAGAPCRASVLDVTDEAATRAFFEGLDRLDGLVNCAGVLAREREFEIATFERVLAVNLTGAMRAALAAKDLLAASGGAIVNTASMYAYFGGPHAPAYSASKGGVAQLTKALAGAWAKDGVRVNAVAPGWIETAMTETARSTPHLRDAILARTAMGRFGKPEEVGALIAWLLSDEARFVTGAVYPVDGGYSAM